MSKEKKKVEFWDLPDAEWLYHTDKNDAIEAIIDSWHPKPIEGTFELCGYARMSIGPGYLDVLGYVLERLDEEYGDPDGYTGTEPTQAMKDAEKAFIDTIVSEYFVWACEPIVTEQIDAMAWVKEHRPDWLESCGE